MAYFKENYATKYKFKHRKNKTRCLIFNQFSPFSMLNLGISSSKSWDHLLCASGSRAETAGKQTGRYMLRKQQAGRPLG